MKEMTVLSEKTGEPVHKDQFDQPADTNPIFIAEYLMKDGDDAGVSLEHIGQAISTWRAMRGGKINVAMVARVFNTTQEIVRDAVETAYWCSLEGPDDAPLGSMMVVVDGA